MIGDDMNTNKLERIINSCDERLTNEQIVMTNHHLVEGWDAYLEFYQDYSYVVLVKNGKGGGVKRLNRTGHNVYI